MKSYQKISFIWTTVNFLTAFSLARYSLEALPAILIATIAPLSLFFFSEAISEWSFLSFGFLSSLAKDSGQQQPEIVIICIGWFLLSLETIFIACFFSW